MAQLSDLGGFGEIVPVDCDGVAVNDRHLACIEQELVQDAAAVLDEFNAPPGAAWTGEGTIVAGVE